MLTHYDEESREHHNDEEVKMMETAGQEHKVRMDVVEQVLTYCK
jgi:hypothetical protein